MGILTIDLLDTKFTIKADEDDAYLENLLAYYRKTIQQIGRDTALTNPTQLSILAGIMLCDELYKEKTQINKYKKLQEHKQPDTADDKTEQLALSLIAKLDKALE
ncbi:MAG TPA: cell division protein ZapA [Candidatus Treponema faecavium]|nr:cell division protein ZapA [Candidatus Treponema faecavium]